MAIQREPAEDEFRCERCLLNKSWEEMNQGDEEYICNSCYLVDPPMSLVDCIVELVERESSDFID